jgi:hypothetical protein
MTRQHHTERSLIVPGLFFHNYSLFSIAHLLLRWALLFYGKIKRMATQIYKIYNVKTIDGINIEIIPLKIKYMRQVMDLFSSIKDDSSEDEIIDILCECVRISMIQYYPPLSNKFEDIVDNFDINTLYDILENSVGIKINKKKNIDQDSNQESKTSKESSNWEDLDLAKLENEIFLLGIWKDYDELERSISMPELLSTISSRRDLDYQEKKFLAAIQGVDLEGEDSKGSQKEWEDMKARVFSGGATSDSNDILALQGQNAVKAGFGIGFGLDYEDSRDPAVML